jgi:hypothetical protein
MIEVIVISTIAALALACGITWALSDPRSREDLEDDWS